MKLNEMAKEDLEMLSYTDITYKILKEDKKTLKTADIFKRICKLLDYSSNEYDNLIGDFYTSLVTDKRFVLINGSWDLQEKHDIKLDDDDDEDIENEEEPLEDEEEEKDEEEPLEEDLDVDDDDDLGDLTIIDEEEE